MFRSVDEGSGVADRLALNQDDRAPEVAKATADLLWETCRLVPDLERCQTARDAGADLTLAADLAVIHRTSGLMWRVVRQWADDSAPWAERVRSDAARCAARAALVLPRIAAELLEPLAEAGLQPLILKGAAMIDRYPSPSFRPMDDIDLLLPSEFSDAAVETLTRRGWRVHPAPERRHEVFLDHPELPGLPVELHHELALWAQRSSWLTAADLWRARRPTTLFGVPAFGLDRETELVWLATHAGKPFHTFQRLIWSVDVATVIQSAGSGHGIDWDRVEALAERSSARTVLAIALDHAARIGASSPERLREIRTSRLRRRMIDPVLSANWPLWSFDPAEHHRLGYALIDARQLQMRWVYYELTEAGPAEVPRRAVATVKGAVKRWWSVRRGWVATDDLQSGRSVRLRPPTNSTR